MVELFDTTLLESFEHLIHSFSVQTLPSIDITPTLLVQGRSTRRIQEASLDASILDIVDTRATIARLKEKLETLDSSLRHRQSVLMFARSPVSCLPTEIIHNIFALVVRPDVEESVYRQTLKSVLSIRMSHVCSRWRSVALEMQELWTRVEVPDDCPGMFEVFADRCSAYRPRRVARHRNKPLVVSRSDRVVRSGKHPKNRFGFSFTDDQFRLIDSLILDGELSQSFIERFDRNLDENECDLLDIACLHMMADTTVAKGALSDFDSRLAPYTLCLSDANDFLICHLVCFDELHEIRFDDCSNAVITRILEHTTTFITLAINGGERLGDGGSDFVVKAPEDGRRVLFLELKGCEVETVHYIFTEWKMPELVDLELGQWGFGYNPLDPEEYTDLYQEGFRSLCVNSRRIHCLSLAVESPVYCALSVILADPATLPHLETLEVRVHDWDNEDPPEDDYYSILEIIERRVKFIIEETPYWRGKSEKFPALVVSPALVPQDHVLKLQDLVDNFSYTLY